MGNSTQTFFTDQFLLSYINYALALYAQISSAASIPDMAHLYSTANTYQLNYLMSNSNFTKDYMLQQLANRQSQIISIMESYSNN